MTFSRASTATYIDSSGVMQTAAIDVERTTYDPLTHVSQGFLLESQSINRAFQSAALTVSPWGAGQDVVKTSSSAVTAPDATTVTALVVDDSTSIQHYFQQTSIANVDTTVPYTFSIFVKDSNHRYVNISFYDSTTTTNVLTGGAVDLTAKTIAVPGAKVSGQAVLASWNQSLTEYGNGWFRVSLTGTLSTTAHTTMTLRIYLNNSATLSSQPYAGTGTGCYFWGAQLEAGSAVTSYIPTTSAAVTRAADIVTADNVATATGTESDSYIGSSLVASPGTATGIATSSIIGSSQAASPGIAIGAESDSYIGSSQAKSPATATGIEGDSYVGSSQAASPGTATGTESDSYVGSSADRSVATATGTSTADAFVGLRGVATGVATSSFVGASQDSAVASAVGIAAGSFVGNRGLDGIATATASSSVTAVGVSTTIRNGVATATGIAVASGKGQSGIAASASGTAVVHGAASSYFSFFSLANAKAEGISAVRGTGDKVLRLIPKLIWMSIT